MNIFDVIGPAMIGPSSSHTAGASRAGLVARYLLGKNAKKAHITLYGSFAKTYQGHGADRAIVGGILGFSLDDTRLRDSFKYAADAGLDFKFEISDEDMGHPNTSRIKLWSHDGETIDVLVRSVGGGFVNVVEINGGEVLFSAMYDTTVVFNHDRPGTVAKITQIFADFNINIAFMRVFRKYEGKDAVMVIETDQCVGDELLDSIKKSPNVKKVITIPSLGA